MKILLSVLSVAMLSSNAFAAADLASAQSNIAQVAAGYENVRAAMTIFEKITCGELYQKAANNTIVVGQLIGRAQTAKDLADEVAKAGGDAAKVKQAAEASQAAQKLIDQLLQLEGQVGGFIVAKCVKTDASIEVQIDDSGKKEKKSCADSYPIVASALVNYGAALSDLAVIEKIVAASDKTAEEKADAQKKISDNREEILKAAKENGSAYYSVCINADVALDVDTAKQDEVDPNLKNWQN